MRHFLTSSGVLFVFTILYYRSVAANTIEIENNWKELVDLEMQNNDPLLLRSQVDEFLKQDLLPAYFKHLLTKIELDPTLTVLNDVLAEVSQPCRNHTTAWIQSFSNTTLLFGNNSWALKMIDAWTKIPEGVLSGHTTSWGDFDECLAVRAAYEDENGNKNEFKGKYCANTIYPVLPNGTGTAAVGGELIGSGVMQLFMLIPKMGSCYPSSCCNEDVLMLLNRTLNFIPAIGQFVIPKVDYCTTDDDIELNNGDIAMASVLSLILALCVSGTILDLKLNYKSSNRNGYGIQALLAFSVYTNTKKWLNTKGGGGGGGENFGCIHGIRFLSTCWVVLGHQWERATVNSWNMIEVGQLYKANWTLFSILNPTVSVDTFFTMSGLLFAYNMLKVLQKSRGRINVPMMYVHRYLRLTPTYALLIGLVATFYAYLGNGPQWNIVINQSESCKNNWWHNLLYINNFVDYLTNDINHQMCHAETWYLANDMQFFLVSPLLIYPLFKWERIGTIILALVSAASVATPWIVHATYEPTLVPTLIPTRVVGIKFMESYYRPWMRFGPYAIGLWTGFLLFKTANKKIKLPKLIILAGWMLSTAIAPAIVFGIIPWFDPTNEIPRGLGAFYAGSHRFAWGMVIAWIIFACSRGFGGPINAFLSWKVFIPLGRLSFCVYLISLSLQVAYSGRQLQVTTYDIYATTNLFFSHLVTSLLVSFFCCITMESPFIALEKLLFQGTKESAISEKPVDIVHKDVRPQNYP